ncbi:MAG: hypothetical protein H5T61_15205, partial [Thermoflexales bacterium]|nr:hypothetical protein [Thermoflexales bacterium]MBC7228556.1 hypothetical protein [Thermoflexales bacterium]
MRKKWQACAIVALVVLSLVATGVVRAQGKGIFVATLQARDGARQGFQAPSALTLKEAYRVLKTYALQESAQAVITGLQSVEMPGDSPDAGRDGRRRGWMGILQTSQTQLVVWLEDGKVADSAVQPLAESASALPEPILDSPEVLRKVEFTYPEFGPSTNLKGQGVHFWFSVTGSQSAVVGVVGAMGTRRAQVLVDARSGGIISAQIYTWAKEGGVLYSPDGGQTWFDSNLRGRMVRAITADPVDATIAYAVGPGDYGITVYRTQDSGQHWEEWGHLPSETGDWPFDVVASRDDGGHTTLLVATWTGIWESRDGLSWIRVKDGPPGPVQWLAGLKSRDGERIVASVTAGEDRGLYVSNAGRWTLLARGLYRLSPSSDQRSLIALNDESPGKAWLIEAERQEMVPLSTPVLEAAGDFPEERQWLVRSPTGEVGVYHRSSGDVEWTLPGPIASLAVSPDFQRDGLALAGGFRSGIFRTTDGGYHWERTLAQPSSLIPGSDEIYEIVFLSPKTVLAIQGGRVTWQQ